MNFKLENVEIVDRERFPQLVRRPLRACARYCCWSGPRTNSPPPLPQLSVRSLFIRGGIVRYVHLPPDAVDTELLQDAARREAMIVKA